MPAVELIVGVGILSSTYARVLYDRGCKTLRGVLKSVSSLLSHKFNHSGGKGHGKGKSCVGPATFNGYRRLLVSLIVTVVISTSAIDGGAVDGVKDLVAADGNIEGG